MGRPHFCHVPRCPVPVPRRMLMCLRHWRMVPKDLQRAVWRTYQPGQEHGQFLPSEEWHQAADAAIVAALAAEPKHAGRTPEAQP